MAAAASRQARFTQADIARAVKGARKAQLEIAAVRIEPDGSITLIPGSPASVQPSPDPNTWDEKWEEKP